MRAAELDHVLRAVDEVTKVDHRFLLIGSQAILAHIDPDYFPDLIDDEILFVSQEIDVAALVEEKASQERLADVIDGALGELSQFDQTYGYYADGVVVGTATLPDGWESRLKPYESSTIPVGKFFALSYGDLAVSKLMAGRPKDIEFVKGMCVAQPWHPGLQQVSGLLKSLPPSAILDMAMERWSIMAPPSNTKPGNHKPF